MPLFKKAPNIIVMVSNPFEKNTSQMGSCFKEGWNYRYLSSFTTQHIPPNKNWRLESNNWWFGSMFLLFHGGQTSGSMLGFRGCSHRHSQKFDPPDVFRVHHASSDKITASRRPAISFHQKKIVGQNKCGKYIIFHGSYGWVGGLVPSDSHIKLSMMCWSNPRGCLYQSLPNRSVNLAPFQSLPTTAVDWLF